MSKINSKQKENLAVFYNNLALAVLTFGVISPIFTGINDYGTLGLKMLLSLIITIFLLKISLDFLR